MRPCNSTLCVFGSNTSQIADITSLRSGKSIAATSLSAHGTPSPHPKRGIRDAKIDRDEDEEHDDEEPVRKRSRRNGRPEKTKQSKQNSADPISKNPPKSKAAGSNINGRDSDPKSSSKQPLQVAKARPAIHSPHLQGPEEANGKRTQEEPSLNIADSPLHEDPAKDIPLEEEEEEADSEEEDRPEIAAKAREKVQSTLKNSGKDPYPDWQPGEPVPYAALCTTFSLIEMTTKRLIISAHCSLFLRQVLRLTPKDLLATVQLMINKLAADYAGIELGIGESLIMKAIGETTGRSLSVIKADQHEIGDLGLVAVKSRSSQPTMFKPKALAINGVLSGLMAIATVQGHGSQDKKVAGIKKLLSAADASLAGKGSKSIDITKDKGGASEAKFLIRFLEGKLRLGLAEKTVLVALAHAFVIHETEKKGNKLPSSEQLAKGESILKTVYR